MPLEIHPERSGQERKPLLIIPALIWLGIVIATIVIALQLSGCAAERFMTQEQDDEMRANCSEHGCTVIPNPVWQQIEAILKRSGAL